MFKKERLFEHRVLNRLKQNDIAEHLGISQSLYSLIESGKRQPSENLLHKLNQMLEGENEWVT